MKIWAAALLTLFSFKSAWAGSWSKLNKETIRFEGEIKSDEYDRFLQVMSEDVGLLVVDSGGGETSAALKIGWALRNAKIKIKVENWCLSSCANYLFLGAISRDINSGIVGFHGNITACAGGAKWQKIEEQLKKQGISEEKIEAFQKETLVQIENEQLFLEAVNVKQELFDITCVPDKGVGDGNPYDFLIPLQSTRERFGIDNVIGEQNIEVVRRFPRPLAVY